MGAYVNDLAWLLVVFLLVGGFAFVAVVMGLMYLGYRKFRRTRGYRKPRSRR